MIAQPSSQRLRPMLSILVVSWNTRELLRDALESLDRPAPEVPHETWVVDNASTDGTLEMVSEEFPAVRCIANAENRGFAAANNQAAASAGGELFLLLNSDTVVRPGAVDALVTHLMRWPGVAAVGPRLVGLDGRVQRSCGRAPTVRRELTHLAHLEGVFDGIQEPCERWFGVGARDVAVLQGACLLIRRSAFEAVGGLDEGYHMYSEEVELCDRLRGLGWRLQWVPTAEVVHVGGGSSRQASDRSFRDLYAGKVRFFQRNRSPSEAAAFKTGLVALALPRIAVGAAASLVPDARRGRAARRAARYVQLLRDLPAM